MPRPLVASSLAFAFALACASRATTPGASEPAGSAGAEAPRRVDASTTERDRGAPSSTRGAEAPALSFELHVGNKLAHLSLDILASGRVHGHGKINMSTLMKLSEHPRPSALERGRFVGQLAADRWSSLQALCAEYERGPVRVYPRAFEQLDEAAELALRGQALVRCPGDGPRPVLQLSVDDPVARALLAALIDVTAAVSWWPEEPGEADRVRRSLRCEVCRWAG